MKDGTECRDWCVECTCLCVCPLLLVTFDLCDVASALFRWNMADIKNFLYAWLGKQKLTPTYEIKAAGNKNRQKFMCEVSCRRLAVMYCVLRQSMVIVVLDTYLGIMMYTSLPGSGGGV